MTVLTAQLGHHSRPTTQRINQQLIRPWTGVIAILEEQQLIQGLNREIEIIVQTYIKRCHDCGNDPWRCLGCQACGVQDCRLYQCYEMLIPHVLFKICVPSGSADLTNLLTFHAEILK